jgi:PAS domain S-box-containing protein
VNILIAEDSPTQAQRLLHILRQRGWGVTAATNGREALQLALQERPALIISDVVMPEMDGYELTREIKANPRLRDVPVILVTTMSDPQDVIRGLECGADCFILKPYDEQHLVGRVQYILLNREFRHSHDSGMGVEIHFNGQRHYITADRLQILNLLLSTYDAAIQRNQELSASQEALERTSAEVQAANRFLDSVIENMPVAIFVKDATNLLSVRVNRAAELLVGRSREELLGKPPFSVLPAEAADAFNAASQRVLAKGVVEDIIWSDVPSFNRGKLSLHTRMVPVLDGYGDPSHLLIMCDDVTDQVRADAELKALNAELMRKTEELERARREAEEANRAKSAFLAAMSHEIRTPMNGVLGMVDVLHQTSLKGHQAEMVDLIRESAFSLLNIIEDILDFSKIEAGKLEIESAPISVADVAEKACVLLDNLASKKGVDLTLFIDPAIPAQVLGDALRVRQVLINIVNNAIKFSSGGERTGRVSVRATLASSSRTQVTLELRVTDNGIGMDERTQARLFTSFSQADVSTTRRFGGTGLGLAISNHLVSLMGGRISVYSAPGEGSTFIVHLPCALVPQAADSNGHAAVSDVAGLHCVVVGGPDGLAEDHAAYLEHDGAIVERVADLATARSKTVGYPPGVTVWVIDMDSEPPSADELRAAANAPTGQDIRIVVVAIERCNRSAPRREDTPGLVMLNGNALTRARLLKAVALAAGRIQEQAQDERMGSLGLPQVPPSRKEALRQGRLVLVTEDNETNQKVVLRQLGLLGISADVVSDGQAALAMWRSGDYALLLTDLHMPLMDGYQLTLAIRAEEKAGGRKRTPIIALSANAVKDEAQRCHTLGMDDYLSKPALLADLSVMLQKWLPPLPASPASPAPSEPFATSSASPAVAPPVPAGEVPVDVRVLAELVGNDPAVIDEFLQEFQLSLREAAAQIRATALAGQVAATAQVAHKLKSSARAVGALALGDLCERIEREGNAGRIADVAALLPAFEAEMAAVEQYLAAPNQRSH